MRRFQVDGNVGRIDDVKTVSIKGEERKVLNFSLAYNEGPKDARVTTWYECAAWGKRAEWLAKALSKGNYVRIEGDHHVETYKAKDGSTGVTQRVTISDVFGANSAASNSSSASEESSDANFTDNDIPF